MPGTAYRAKAAELRAEATLNITQKQKAELEVLALRYIRLAEQADRNAKTDVVYVTPMPKEPSR
jgi:hypothetical protein